jgi:hypothetical protein
MAKELDSFFRMRAPLFDEIARAEADPANELVLVNLHRPLAERTADLVERAGVGISLCAGDPAMIEVMKRMP